jgi:hypothetical protein
MGSNANKELDFLHWCTRTDGSSTSTAPSTNISDILNTLDWHDTYRRRVFTERNRRHNHSKQTTLPLPSFDGIQLWGFKEKCATAAILREHAGDTFTSLVDVSQKSTKHHLIAHSSNNDATCMSQPFTLVELKLFHQDAKIATTGTRMSHQFVVTVVKHPDGGISTTEIRNRNTLVSYDTRKQFQTLSELKHLTYGLFVLEESGLR